MSADTCNNTVTDIYFSQLPPTERNNLCKVLYERNEWQQLAEEMKFNNAEIQDIRRTAAQSNTTEPEVLFTIWGDHMNHTITELFVVLSRIPNYSAMRSIQHLVAPKYHRLLKKQTNAIATTNIPATKKLLNCTVLSDENNPTDQATPTELPSSALQPVAPKDVRSSDFNAMQYASTIPKISYQELCDATREFSSSHVLGTGGFGTVFRGVWKCTAVAIKRIESRDTRSAKIQIQQSVNELRCLNYCRHDNILPLYAYSMDDGEAPCLVYQLMTGGSVEQRLFKVGLPELMLQWPHRMDIAIGTARGLQYLHTFNGNGKPLIHGDIKPANILLDKSNQPKIGDFGLAREGNFQDAAMEVSRVYGTRPYLPREFLLDRTLSTKVDTFSFGIVLLELATGLRAYDKSYNFLSQYVRAFDEDRESELMDAKLQPHPHREAIFRRMMRQGKRCSQSDAVKRPGDMVQVLRELENDFVRIDC